MNERGFQLIELVVALAIFGMIVMIAGPPLLSMTASLRVDLATQELVGVLRHARSYAIKHSANVAVRFYPEPERGRTGFALFRDADGDGVLNADIRRGIDPQLTPMRYFAHFGGPVGFGFPPGAPPRDPGDPRRRLGNLDDPVRFNNSDLASFDPLGGSTPGSLYVTDGRSKLSVVRLYGRTGTMRVLRWDAAADRWR
jgi:prepilin-type N-terminal cleavage/methylation domain-containing protein